MYYFEYDKKTDIQLSKPCNKQGMRKIESYIQVKKRGKTNLDSKFAFRNISALRAHLIIRISWGSRVPPHHFSNINKYSFPKSRKILANKLRTILQTKPD